MPARLELLKHAIAAQEGFFVTQVQAEARGIPWPTVPQRLHNPGDLLYEGQAGAQPHPVTGHDGKIRDYCEFADDDAGFCALENQIRLDAERGLTFWQFIQKYAPSADSNDPSSYFAGIARTLAVGPGDPLANILT